MIERGEVSSKVVKYKIGVVICLKSAQKEYAEETTSRTFKYQSKSCEIVR